MCQYETTNDAFNTKIKNVMNSGYNPEEISVR